MAVAKASPATTKKQSVRAGVLPVRLSLKGVGSSVITISIIDRKGKVVGRSRMKISDGKLNPVAKVKLNARGMKQLKKRGVFRGSIVITGKDIDTRRSRFTLR